MITIFALRGGTDVADYVQKEFRDAAFTMRIVKKDEKALSRINKDFGEGFRFDASSIRLKEPSKLRLDADVEDTTISYVVNGATGRYRLPKLRLNVKRDLSKSPGSRQTALDFGFLTPSLFVDLFDAAFVRTDPATGLAEFDLTYKPVYADPTRFHVWLDPAKRTVVRRDWFNREGKRIATFRYEAPTTEGRSSMPTRLTIESGDGAVAGVVRYERVRIDRGIDDAVFDVG